jgi:hypothetical protein
VTISGDKDAIEELEKVCKSPELFIGKERGRFVLKSKGFNELSNDEEIYKQACETVARLNAAVKLAWGYKGYLRVEDVVRVSDSSQWNLHGILSGGSSSSGKLIMKITKADGTIVSEVEPVLKWVILATNNGDVDKVLRLLVMENAEWPTNFYRIFEIIKGDIKDISKKGWVTVKAIARFRRTVQSPEIVGDIARHGKQKEKPPSNPMDFYEAKAFINTIVLNWLRSKIDEKSSISNGVQIYNI